MIRETSSPVFFASWKDTGRRPTWSWTLMRISVISCCAPFERSWTSAYELSPCTRVAASTPPTRGASSSTRRAPITSSMRNLVEPGRTSPATRFVAIRTKPGARRPPRGRTRAQMSGRRSRSRSGFEPRAARRDSRVATRAVCFTDPFYRGGRTGPAGSAGASASRARATGGAGHPPPLGLAGGPQLVDEAGHVVDPSAAQAGHHAARSSRCRNFRPHWQRTRRATKCRVCRWCMIFITPLSYAKRIPAGML